MPLKSVSIRVPYLLVETASAAAFSLSIRRVQRLSSSFVNRSTPIPAVHLQYASSNLHLRHAVAAFDSSQRPRRRPPFVASSPMEDRCNSACRPRQTAIGDFFSRKQHRASGSMRFSSSAADASGNADCAAAPTPPADPSDAPRHTSLPPSKRIKQAEPIDHPKPPAIGSFPSPGSPSLAPPSASRSPPPSSTPPSDFPPLFDLLREPGWRAALEAEFRRPYMRQLQQFLAAEARQGQQVYPPLPALFEAFNQCPLESVRVVILGQDPYHGPGQAMGLCFSVPPGVPPPSSLQNVFKEMRADGALAGPPSHGCLTGWAQQGVLLLNTVLTVRAGQPNSHAKQGWEHFTDAALRAVVARRGSAVAAAASAPVAPAAGAGAADRAADTSDAQPRAPPGEGRGGGGVERPPQCPVVFLLWGNHAKTKAKVVPPSPSAVLLSAAHPSGLSAHRGFFGCRHFSQVNEILQKHGHPGIRWELEPLEGHP